MLYHESPRTPEHQMIMTAWPWVMGDEQVAVQLAGTRIGRVLLTRSAKPENSKLDFDFR